MFRIHTAAIGDAWIVSADWYGQPRVVFTGTIFECCQYVREMSR